MIVCVVVELTVTGAGVMVWVEVFVTGLMNVIGMVKAYEVVLGDATDLVVYLVVQRL